MLENRLDKAMIKYNEAQSIRKTYEQIVKRLKASYVVLLRSRGIGATSRGPRSGAKLNRDSKS